MSSRSIALIIGLVVFAGGSFLLGPRDCVGRNDGNLDPLEVWDECRTYGRLTITLPHADGPTSAVDVEPGPPAKPQWGAVMFPLGMFSLVAFVTSYLVLEWRRSYDLLGPG